MFFYFIQKSVCVYNFLVVLKYICLNLKNAKKLYDPFYIYELNSLETVKPLGGDNSSLTIKLLWIYGTNKRQI